MILWLNRWRDNCRISWNSCRFSKTCKISAASLSPSNKDAGHRRHSSYGGTGCDCGRVGFYRKFWMTSWSESRDDRGRRDTVAPEARHGPYHDRTHEFWITHASDVRRIDGAAPVTGLVSAVDDKPNSARSGRPLGSRQSLTHRRVYQCWAVTDHSDRIIAVSYCRLSDVWYQAKCRTPICRTLALSSFQQRTEARACVCTSVDNVSRIR